MTLSTTERLDQAIGTPPELSQEPISHTTRKLSYLGVPAATQALIEKGYVEDIAKALSCEVRDLSFELVQNSKDDNKFTSGAWYLYKTPDKTSPSWYVNQKREPVAAWHLSMMKGCCGICVSWGAGVRYRFTRKGLGEILNRLRVSIARSDGYGLLLCTDVLHNTAQRRILQKGGWQDIQSFTNPRTGNKVAISTISLTERLV